MLFSIIGTGNMAWFLARKLSAAGHHFEGVLGRNVPEAGLLAAQYNSMVYPDHTDIPDQPDHYCFLAVKDTAIEEVAAPLSFTDTVLVHHGGALSVHVLKESAAHFGVVWPVYSIIKNSLTDYNDIPFAVEGSDPQTEKQLLAIAHSMSSSAFLAIEVQRNALHLSAVFANNFTNHLLAIAADICNKEKLSFEYLKPIIAQTFERISGHDPKSLQTGPAVRNDEKTMSKHIGLLQNDPDRMLLYQTLSASIRKMYEKGAE